ncbi:hypothetical protein G3O00_04060 [Burkholderia sp. Ac-20384]|nr:hypothetical protein [Burkholderia sp. Ac-20384]
MHCATTAHLNEAPEKTDMTIQKTLAAACAVTLLASGCATQNGTGGISSESVLRCTALGAGGALVGALIGGTKGAIGGAVAGLAACAVIEVATRQTKTAAEVDRDYRASNRNNLPPYAKIDAYTTVVTPRSAVKTGEPIKLASQIRAVSGTNEPVQEVKEVVTVYAPSGEQFKRGEKVVNAAPGSGEFDNSFTLKLPSGAPQGTYTLKSQVYLNGKPGSTRQSSIQLAQVDGVTVVALLDAPAAH